MAYDPNRHHRRSTRLKGYDYTQEGAYFITICTQDKTSYFGTIRDGRMILNEAGSMVNDAWSSLPETNPGVEIDEFITMPNHLHGIVVLSGESVQDPDGKLLSLGEVVKKFKNWTITRYIQGVKQAGWRRFSGRLWQRNYHDRIIRNQREIERIRHYVHYNPLGWEDDDYHPVQVQRKGPSADPLRMDADWLESGNDGDTET